MKTVLSLALLLSTCAWANLHLAPPDFETSHGRGVFVDFKTATYSVTFDVGQQTAVVKSVITFHAAVAGHPLLDLVPSAQKVKIDGRTSKLASVRFPGKGPKVRLLKTLVEPGEHTLELENALTTNVKFDPKGRYASSAFWIRDLKDRMFLEQYVPSNFEFDQYKMTLNIEIKGSRKPAQDIYTNGAVTKLSESQWRIDFPAHFTVSAPFFHMTRKGAMRRLDFTHTSVDGRSIPITVYSPFWKRTTSFKHETLRVMKELEADYGPWGHPSFVAYGTFMGTGGMEHAGATATSFSALDHEMLHCYFAKGVFPANGNAGWIDEAIASWRDRGYQRHPLPNYSGSDLGLGTVYQRNTDRRAYKLGASFMAYLDYKLQDVGGLKAFLRGYFQAYKHTVVTQEHFKNNLEFFSGLDLTQDFTTWIWGKNEPSEKSSEGNVYHPELSVSELESLL